MHPKAQQNQQRTIRVFAYGDFLGHPGNHESEHPMRAIADVRDMNKIRILKICGSQYISIRDFGVFQVERDRARRTLMVIPERFKYKLAIVELNTTRNKGDIVDASELTIIHEENPVK